jgi:hypothetical protein
MREIGIGDPQVVHSPAPAAHILALRGSPRFTTTSSNPQLAWVAATRPKDGQVFAFDEQSRALVAPFPGVSAVRRTATSWQEGYSR